MARAVRPRDAADFPARHLRADTRGAGFVIQPTIVPQHSGARLRDETEPLPTIVGIARVGRVQPGLPEAFIYEPHGERDTQAPRVHDLNKPALTITPRGAGTLVQAGQPLRTIKDAKYKPKITINGGLFVIESYFRMLRNLELARATDLVDERRGYTFPLRWVGTRDHTSDRQRRTQQRDGKHLRACFALMSPDSTKTKR